MLNLKVASLEADLQIRTAKYDAQMKKIRADLQALTSRKYEVSLSAPTKRVDAAMAAVKALRAEAKGPITVRIEAATAGPKLAQSLAGIRSVKKDMGRGVTIPIRADANRFWRVATRIESWFSRMRKGQTIEVRLDDAVATAKLRATKDRIDQIRKRAANIPVSFAGGGPRGAGGGGGGKGGGRSRALDFGAGLASGSGLPLYGSPQMMAGELAARGVRATVGKAVTTAAEVETTMIRIGQAAGVAGPELDALKNRLLSLASSKPGAATGDVLEASLIGAKQGVAPGELEGFASALISIKNAAGDAASMEDLATTLRKTLNTFGLATKDVNGLGSALVALDNSSTANIGEIMDVVQRMSGTAHKLGMTAPQTMAMATSMIERGLTPETAGTAGSQILGRLATDRDTFAGELGIPKEELGSLVRTDMMGALRRVFAQLEQMDPLKQLDVTESLGLKGQRVKGGFLQLAGEFGKTAPRVATAEHEMATGGALTRFDEALAGSTSAKMQTLGNQVEQTAETFGARLKPATDAVIDGLTGLVKWLNRAAGGTDPEEQARRQKAEADRKRAEADRKRAHAEAGEAIKAAYSDQIRRANPRGLPGIIRPAVPLANPGVPDMRVEHVHAPGLGRAFDAIRGAVLPQLGALGVIGGARLRAIQGAGLGLFGGMAANAAVMRGQAARAQFAAQGARRPLGTHGSGLEFGRRLQEDVLNAGRDKDAAKRTADETKKVAENTTKMEGHLKTLVDAARNPFAQAARAVGVLGP